MGGSQPPLPLSRVAVAQTPGEATGSLLRVGSGIGHRIRQATPVRLDAVAPSPSDAHLTERAAAFPRRLYATASRESSTKPGGESRLSLCVEKQQHRKPP
jgi:hypothetical protein